MVYQSDERTDSYKWHNIEDRPHNELFPKTLISTSWKPGLKNEGIEIFLLVDNHNYIIDMFGIFSTEIQV